MCELGFQSCRYALQILNIVNGGDLRVVSMT